MKWRAGLLLLVCLAALPARAAELKIETFTLKNGMEVIVIENHRVPAVSHMLWFRVGAIDDPHGKSGLAHYHEHMMFQGTRNYRKGEYASIIARNGGTQNAFTGHDATAYYINITRDQLPLAMELEADRLRALDPKLDDAEKEREVIIEERRERVENDPESLFSEQMAAALFMHHPYRLPIIGWKHEMEKLAVVDVLKLHEDYYHPGNAMLIVSGDITADELRPLAEKYYADIPAGPKAVRSWNQEPPHLAARRLSMTHRNVQQPLWRRMYIAPGANYGESRHTMPLCLLEQLLGGGRTSRLYQSLVATQKIAVSVDADYDGFSIGPSEFSIDAFPAANVDPAQVEAAIDAELAKIIRDGVDKEELARAKTLLKADTIYAREGLQSIAYILGWLRAAGLSTDYFLKWPEKIDAVTAQEVQDAAKAVFDTRHSVTGVLLPETKEKITVKVKTK